MNFDDIFNTQNTNGISPEKLAFLKAMASKQTGGSTQEMMAALMSASGAAKKQGVSFNEQERDMMLELILKNMSPEEAKRARNVIQMMKKMKR